MQYTGACHCGAVAFRIEAPEDIECHQCNCSICRLSGYLHLILPQEKFELLRGADALVTYTFNTRVAQHYFCRTCGIKSYYVPRSNPDGVSINVRCLIPAPRSLRVVPFDGADWERNAGALAHLSQGPRS